jgi:hydrogenase maturation protease
MKTLLLGMGNSILCDDAVGVRLAQDFKTKLMHIPDLDVMEECSVGGINLLEVFSGYQRVVVLDSFQTSDGIPGDWYHFTAPEFCAAVHLTNIHDTNFATAMQLGYSIGMALPQLSEIHVFGVEIKENLIFSAEMTPELEESYPRYAPAIFNEVRRLLCDPQASSPAPRNHKSNL